MLLSFRLFVILRMLACTFVTSSIVPPETRASEDGGRFAMPINAAETMIVPFWDRNLVDLSAWRVTAHPKAQVRLFSGWDSTRLGWEGAAAGTEVATISSSLGHDLTRYDLLVVNVQSSPGSRIRIDADTDRGVLTAFWDSAAQPSKEIPLPLNGATVLKNLTVTVIADDARAASGLLTAKWVMLVHQGRLADTLAAWSDIRVADWERYLVAVPPASPKPQLELWVSADEVTALRARMQQVPDAKNPFLRVADAARRGAYDSPEKLIREYTGWNSDRRYTRERDVQSGWLTGRTELADAGLLLEDSTLLRLAARTALSLAATPRWDAGPTTRSLVSEWETRPFVSSLVASELVYYLDLAGSQFTPEGRDFILRRLTEEGIGTVNHSVWRHDYIFGNNQFAVFNQGRVLAYLALERYRERVQPYTELAMQELAYSVGRFLFDDGGYIENPGYYHYTLANLLPTYEAYARARGLAVADVLPRQLQRSVDYIELFQSTTAFDAVIPLGDGFGRAGRGNVDVAIRMAGYFPQSQWTALARRHNPRLPSVPRIPTWIAGAKIGLPPPAIRPFVHLPSIGTAASVRRLGDKTVKLLVVGHAANAGHVHEDRGSFVLEFGGEAFAADFDNFPYDDPRGPHSRETARHNVLVPYGTLEKPAQDIAAGTFPTVRGDERTFSAEFDLAPHWKGWFTVIRRRFDSPSPDRLRIHDSYELIRGEGAEFRWHTTLPIEIVGPGHAIVRGSAGEAHLHYTTDIGARLERSEMTAGRMMNTLVLSRPGQKGEITVDVILRD